MALNLDMIGKKSKDNIFKYTKDTVILYALGIGAGVDELDFIYEKNLKVFPTFAVVPFMPVALPMFSEINFKMTSVLHGEQKIELHNPIPTSGTFATSAILTAVYDKGDNGALTNWEFETRDENGQLIFVNKASIMDRSAGNFGGDRGPKAERFDPPEGKDPDFRVEYVTSPDQAALYRLSGDKNPLHIEPEFAKAGGLPRPILHGLCTYGFAGRAVLHSVCGSDPARLKSLAVRFLSPVFPGETLITEGWKIDQGKYVIRTTAQDGRGILGNAVAEVV